MLCRAHKTVGCKFTGATDPLCLLELPQLQWCRLVQPYLMISKNPPPPPHTPNFRFTDLGKLDSSGSGGVQGGFQP